MTDPAFCDVPGCQDAWIFVEHKDRIAVKRRCHAHWFADLKLVEVEPLAPAKTYVFKSDGPLE